MTSITYLLIAKFRIRNQSLSAFKLCHSLSTFFLLGGGDKIKLSHSHYSELMARIAWHHQRNHCPGIWKRYWFLCVTQVHNWEESNCFPESSYEFFLMKKPAQTMKIHILKQMQWKQKFPRPSKFIFFLIQKAYSIDLNMILFMKIFDTTSL